MSRVLPPKPRLGPAPPPRPPAPPKPAPLAPDDAWAWLDACLQHYERVVRTQEEYCVTRAIQQTTRALEAVHRAEQPHVYGGTANYG
jgi:hypothetical protein